MLHIVYVELLNSDPDPEKIFRIQQKDADPTGSGTLFHAMQHINRSALTMSMVRPVEPAVGWT
jgi:hypothetical protein